jgi:hypothetical protein
LAREPLALQRLHSHLDDEGQILVGEVHGSTPLTVVCAYRRPGAEGELLHHLDAALAPLQGRSWVLATDWNMNPDGTEFGRHVRRLGGLLAATSQHVRSSRPTDSVWVVPGLLTGETAPLPVLSDHGGSAVTLNCQRNAGVPSWTFRRCAPLLPGPEPPPETAANIWTQCCLPAGAWDLLLRAAEVDKLWSAWTTNAEAYLSQCGLVEPAATAAPRGAVPKPVSGQSRLGQGQSLEERQLRRVIRRCEEALYTTRSGRPLCRQLRRKLVTSCREFGWLQLAAAEAWGACASQARDRLKRHLDKGYTRALACWRHQVSSYEGAAKWAKRDTPQAFLLEDLDGTTVAGRAAGAATLFRAWRPLFTGPEQYTPDSAGLIDAYQDFYPTRPDFQLPDLSVRELRAVARAMRHRAAGTDLWSADALLLLPPPAWDRLVQLFAAVEASGAWPNAFYDWRVTFIPKGSGDKPCHVHDVRPIAVGALLYRIWAKVRFGHAAKAWGSDLLHPLQVGGLPGLDAESLLVALANEAGPDSHPYGVSLDFRKAFDSVDWSTAIRLLRRAGLPTAIAAPLGAMWERQRRWIGFGGSIYPDPIRNVLALPQGDPFSPVALALVLAGPAYKIASRLPTAISTVYLDDRTALFSSLGQLQEYIREWSVFESLGRLRTHEGKTQYWARTPAASRALTRAGLDPKPTLHALGCSLGPLRRALTAKEIKRAQACTAIASRIGLVPASWRVKQRLAATLLSAKAVWGSLLSGRPPTQAECQTHYRNCTKAVRGPGLGVGRASPHLRRVFLLGHTADLKFYALSRLLGAVARWRRFRSAACPSGWSPDTQALANSCLSGFGWAARRYGVGPLRRAPDVLPFRFDSPIRDRSKALHDLRQAWRLSQVRAWVRTDRRDAAAARTAPALSLPVIDAARTASGHLNGWAVAVMTGNAAAAAVDFDSRSVLQSCPHCGLEVVPCLEHVFWSCPAFAHLRIAFPAPPPHPLLRRLGWGALGTTSKTLISLLEQLGRIHEHQLRARLRDSVWSRPRPAPDLLPCN